LVWSGAPPTRASLICANAAINPVPARSPFIHTQSRQKTGRRNAVNSFTLIAVGNLAKNPELIIKGDRTCTRMCLVGNDYAGKGADGQAREIATSLWFVAFESLGEAIARNARKGDQLIVHAQIRANNWTDRDGENQYDHSYVVQGFRFGSPGRTKRGELATRSEQSDTLALETDS
jgi:single-stranded DNA-binding protein